jgi:hypothetical protein
MMATYYGEYKLQYLQKLCIIQKGIFISLLVK